MKNKRILITSALAVLLGLGVGAGMSIGGSKSNSKVAKVSAANDRTIGFVNTQEWENVYAYVWNSSNGSDKNAGWPGIKISSNGSTDASGYDVYTYSYDSVAKSGWDRVIFNAGDGQPQTSNISFSGLNANNLCLYDFSDSSYRWVVSHTWSLCGVVNGAAWANDVATGESNPLTFTDATFTVSLKIDDYFKFRADHAWDYKLVGTQIAGQNSTYFTAIGDFGDENAQVKDMRGGSYTFTINWDVDNYGDKAYAIGASCVSDGETKWKVVGNGSQWVGDFVYENGIAMECTSSTSSEVKALEVNLQAGDKFKFYDGTTWFGWSDVKTSSPLYDAFSNDDQNNLVVNTGYSGVYDFFVETGDSWDGHIFITSDNYVALDAWAKSFVEAEDLCNGSGAEWSTFAVSYAALDDAVKDLFSADKVDAKIVGTYIERAAYRYEFGVIVKGQSAFAEAQRPRNGFASNYSGAAVIRVGINALNENTHTLIIVAVIAGVAALAVGGYFFLRKRKAD